MDVESEHDRASVTCRELRADFCRVVARWRLTQGEVRSLLGLAEPPVPVVEPAVFGPTVVRRAELVVSIDKGLSVLLEDLGRIADWLRTPARPFDGRTPLEAMADLEALVALAKVAGLGRGSGSGDVAGTGHD